MMNKSANKLFGIPLRSLSLITLAVQNSFLILIMRYSRTTAAATTSEKYLTSTAVFIAEIMKLCISTLIHIRQTGEMVSYERLFGPKSEAWKLAVPAVMYTIQNNLQYIAVSRLDAATFQVTYQLKILTTALFSVLMLGKRLRGTQWLSLILLTSGIALVQVQTVSSSSTAQSAQQERQSSETFSGLLAVLSACLISGFSGVYFEKVLKKPTADLMATSTERPLSLWERNIQLAFFSVILALLGVFVTDRSTIVTHGFFVGYSPVVWTVISTQAAGGLLVALVVKYADNILKGFATSISIVLSCIVSIWLFDFSLSLPFAIGCAIVIYSTYMYDAGSAQTPSLSKPLSPAASSQSIPLRSASYTLQTGQT